MNPCPCGYLGHPSKPCRCTPESVARYRNKISGPLLDRIDLTIEVPSLSAAELMQQEAGESSATVLERVTAARKIQYNRQGKVNAELSVGERRWQSLYSKRSARSLRKHARKTVPFRTKFPPHHARCPYTGRFGRRGRSQQNPCDESHRLPSRPLTFQTA